MMSLGGAASKTTPSLKRAADAGRLRLLDLGGALDPDSFWINLKPGAFAGDPRASWLQSDELQGDLARRQPEDCLPTRCISARAFRCGVRSRRPTRNGAQPDLPQTPHDPAQARDCSRRSA